MHVAQHGIQIWEHHLDRVKGVSAEESVTRLIGEDQGKLKQQSGTGMGEAGVFGSGRRGRVLGDRKDRQGYVCEVVEETEGSGWV